MAFLSVIVIPWTVDGLVYVIAGFVTATSVLFSGRGGLHFDAMLCRSARIRAREAAVSVDEFPLQSSDDCESANIWCCCRGYEDHRLMLCCDGQREGCYIWYHYDCLGLSLAEGQRLGASSAPFVCPQCNSTDTYIILNSTPAFTTEQNLISNGPSLSFKPCTDFLCNDISGGEVCEFLISAYEEVIHWKPNIFLLPFGKGGKSFVC